MLWREIGPQPDGDAAVLGVEIDCILRVSAVGRSRPGGGDRRGKPASSAESGGDLHYPFYTLAPELANPTSGFRSFPLSASATSLGTKLVTSLPSEAI